MNVNCLMGKFFPALLLLVSAAVCETTDVVTTRNGGSYKGAILEQDSTYVTLDVEGGSIIRIPQSAVENIQYGTGVERERPVKDILRQGKGYHRHDGFFFAMNVGGGPTFDNWDRSNSTRSGTVKVSGPALDVFDFKIGAALRENLILSADLFGSATLDSRASGSGLNVNGLGLSASPDSVYGEVVASLGVGVTYYFMPRNIFVSGSAGIASMSMYDKYGTKSDSSGSYREDWRYSDAEGYMFRLKVGKEWWVSKNWGLGVSAAWSIFQGKEAKGNEKDTTFAYDSSYKGSLTSQRFSILFSTTFN